MEPSKAATQHTHWLSSLTVVPFCVCLCLFVSFWISHVDITDLFDSYASNKIKNEWLIKEFTIAKPKNKTNAHFILLR